MSKEEKKKKREEYYRLTKIMGVVCQYYMLIGERSNGKTYAVLEYMIEQFFKDFSEFAIIRRWEEDFKKGRGHKMFEGLNDNKVIEKLSKGQWKGVTIMSMNFYLYNFDEDGKRILSPSPIGYAFGLNVQEHDKMTAYPRVKNVLFDEFITRGIYLPDEFITFQQVLSTIIRDRDDVTIFMCGNTVNKYAPYFNEMGLKNIKTMKQGTIDVYTYGEDSELKVAVEYCDDMSKHKKSNVYFAFNNPKLQMITNGKWEINIYPHLPKKYIPKQVALVFYVKFDGDTIQGNVIVVDDGIFIYFHRKTTPIQDEHKEFVYQQEYDYRPYYKRKLTKPVDKIDKKIVELFVKDKVFYQDNEVGEVIRNYLNWCKISN